MIYSDILRKSIFYTGLTVFQFISVLFILTQLLFYFAIPVSTLTLVLSASISVIILYFSVYSDYKRDNPGNQAKKDSLAVSLVVIILSVACIVVSVAFGISFFDATHDSNNYHKPYAIFFANGFNPIVNETPPVVFGIQWQNNLFVSFPKAAELLGSYFYLVSGILESVKAINLVVLLSAIIITFCTFILFIPKKRVAAFLLASAAVLSPVWIIQSTQFYIDGFYYEIILIVLALILYYVKTRGNGNILLTILLGLVLIFNTKGSSLLFVPIFLALFFLLVYIYKPDRKKTVIAISIIAIVVLSVMTGYSSYLVNYSRYVEEYSIYANPLGENAVIEWRDTETGSPLGNHTRLGQEASDSAGINREKSTSGDTSLPPDSPRTDTGITGSGDEPDTIGSKISQWLLPREMFVLYHFSPVSQQYTGMKNPFDINLSEIKELTGENRVNEYGPFLGLILILSLLTLIIALLFRDKGNSDTDVLFIAIAFIFLSVILHPAVFWDRYVPQFYCIIVLIALIGLLSKMPAQNVLSALLLAVLLINIICISAYWYPDSLEKTRQFNNILDGIRESTSDPVYLIHSTDTTRKDISDFSYRLTNIAYLQERGIPWRDGTNVKITRTNYTVPLFFESDAIVIPKSTQYQIGEIIPATVIGRYAVDGFAPTQGAYIWTDKRNVSLNLTIADPPEEAYLLLNALPFHVDDKFISQTLWITVNTMTLPQPYTLTGITENRLVIPLPSHSLVNGSNIIRFNLPHAKQLSKGAYGMSVRSLAITGSDKGGNRY